MEKLIERVTTRGRLLHAMATVAFLHCFMSGIGIAFPKLSWLLVLLGGGEFARWLHPWSGALFAIFAIMMFGYWKSEMYFTAEDRVWLGNIRQYATNRHDCLPEPGKYNAGQKFYFWSIVLGGGIVFTLTGVMMWFPGNFPINLVRLSVVVHELMFIAAGSGLIVHAYMGTIAMPGTLSAMITGEVKEVWAKSHHPKWYREMTGKK
ncbi:MAG: formate dehydrogenase subunit gamma [Desulfuromonadaceae bacterium]